MKPYKLILSSLLLFMARNVSAQFRVTDMRSKHDVQIFITPGVDPAGHRLMQFSFSKFGNQTDSIDTQTFILFSASGKTLSLINPIKTGSTASPVTGKQWNARFALSQREIDFLKAEELVSMGILFNNKPVKYEFKGTAGKEILDITNKYF